MTNRVCARSAAPLLAALAALGGACGSPAPAAGDRDPHPAPAPQQGQVCTPEGFCWSAPLPGGATIRALWGTAWNDLWAGGDALLHFDGAAWSLSTAPMQAGELVRALTGTSARDVWAGGDVLRHFDGTSWTEVSGLPPGEVVALASSPAGVLAVLDDGDGPDERQRIVEGRSGAFTTVVAPTLPDLRALWVATSGSGEAWVAGYDVAAGAARLLHRTAAGQPFNAVPPPASGALVALWGSGPADLWAGGPGLLLHWNGAGWTAAPGIDHAAEIRALWGAGPADVYAATRGGALHYDGTAWTQLLPPRAADPRLARAVWGSGPRNVWLAGDSGLLWQGDRATFVEIAPGPAPFLEAVTATGPSDAWAVGGAGTALHWNGAAWAPVATGVADPIEAVWASSPGDAWAAGSSGDCAGFLLHWDGARWTAALQDAPGHCFRDLSGTGPGDVWAVARGALLHWSGAKWNAEGPADPDGSVFAAGPGEVFVLQDSTQGGPNPPGGVHHLSGGTWSLEQTGATGSLRKLWGAGASDVWAAGDDAGHLWHRTAGGWSEVASGIDDPTPGLSALWGSGPSDVYAASRGAPLLIHWDGHAWTRLATAAGYLSLSGLGGSGAHDVWAVGGDGVILHRQR